MLARLVWNDNMLISWVSPLPPGLDIAREIDMPFIKDKKKKGTIF